MTTSPRTTPSGGTPPAPLTILVGAGFAGSEAQWKYLATMEGAVYSGELAARAILKEER